MAMTMETVGLEQLDKMLTELGNKAQDVASGSLYEGAGVMASAMNAGIESIKTEPFRYAPEGKTRLPSPQEKAALQRKIGIARFKKNGSEVDTLVGMSTGSGYAQIAGKPKAVAVIARTINSGTSFMQKQPVIRRAKSQSQARASQAIVAKADELINEMIKA